jgi:peptide/nickel transport system permease protein
MLGEFRETFALNLIVENRRGMGVELGHRTTRFHVGRHSIWRVFGRISIRSIVVITLSGLAGATLVRFAPGFESDEQILDPRLSRETLAALRKERAGAGNPFRYYAGYLAGLARGDAGRSVIFGQPVGALIRNRFGKTFRTVGLGLSMGWTAALLCAAAAALTRRTFAALIFTLASSSLVSTPAAVLASLCVLWGLPPAVAIAALVFPRVYAQAFGQLREALNAPHVIAARARGMTPARIFIFHVVPPTLWPLIALAGVSLSLALGAAIPVEALADSPGLGQLAWRAALGRDLALLVPITLLLTVGAVIANGAAEIASVSLRRASA